MKGVMSVAKYVAAFIAGLFAAVPDATAQGCAMCYQNAAATGTKGISALQHGILVLFVPAISIFGGILFLLYSRRHGSAGNTVLPRGPMGTDSKGAAS